MGGEEGTDVLCRPELCLATENLELPGAKGPPWESVMVISELIPYRVVGGGRPPKGCRNTFNLGFSSTTHFISETMLVVVCG